MKPLNRFLAIPLMVLLCNVAVYLPAQAIPKASIKLVKSFPIGKGDGELGWQNVTDPDQQHICFDADGFLYITDPANSRISIFDNSFNWKGNIRTHNGFLLISRISIDINGDIIANAGTTGITKIDKLGNTIFCIFPFSEKENDFRGQIRIDGFYAIGNFVVAYLKSGGIVGIQNPSPDYGLNKNWGLKNQDLLERIEKTHYPVEIESLRFKEEDDKSKKTDKNLLQQQKERFDVIIRLGDNFTGERDFKTAIEFVRSKQGDAPAAISIEQELSDFLKYPINRLIRNGGID